VTRGSHVVCCAAHCNRVIKKEHGMHTGSARQSRRNLRRRQRTLGSRPVPGREFVAIARGSCSRWPCCRRGSGPAPKCWYQGWTGLPAVCQGSAGPGMNPRAPPFSAQSCSPNLTPANTGRTDTYQRIWGGGQKQTTRNLWCWKLCRAVSGVSRCVVERLRVVG